MALHEFADGLVWDGHVIHDDAFIEPQDVRRSVYSGLEPLRLQGAVNEMGGRPLAVGAGHVNGGKGEVRAAYFT